MVFLEAYVEQMANLYAFVILGLIESFILEIEDHTVKIRGFELYISTWKAMGVVFITFVIVWFLNPIASEWIKNLLVSEMKFLFSASIFLFASVYLALRLQIPHDFKTIEIIAIPTAFAIGIISAVWIFYYF